ncbi:glycerate kinase [Rhodococcus rhodochrous J3]|uniref:Glycerate kinase n=1 Tax=Rhodococcus rhodochrous J3 TaxID=903528 RepID=A0ABY1MG99_RHORH|nr:glycerate kinase [Rhodococcus rhodochrous]MBF4478972.1 glycerate kinase [Rhodococcus rhodochrous]SMG54921.1 glycerate kinase [Rhodococcus rhodochrous J3]
MRVLIAPDKFKGSLTAAQVADHLATGLATAGIDTHLLPLADGGDGSVDAAVAAGFTPYPVTVAGATGLPHYGRIALRDATAVVEVAGICGLATLPGARTAALDTSSLGLGQAIGHALRHDPTRLVLALGGSASTDGGMGMLAALGFTFHDVAGRQLRVCGRTLPQIHTIDSSRTVNLAGTEIVVAGDVTNPLLGPTGTAAVYGPQKGATDADVRFLDAGLDNLVDAFVRSGYPHAREIANAPGAGSAGGIGFAAMLLGARMVSGAQYFLDLLDFDAALTDVDLVVTGEGSIDEQTEHGKLLAVLAERARPRPVVAVAGRNLLARHHWDSAGFRHIYALGDYTDRDTAGDPHLTGELLTRIGHDIGRTATTSNTKTLVRTGTRSTDV